MPWLPGRSVQSDVSPVAKSYSDFPTKSFKSDITDRPLSKNYSKTSYSDGWEDDYGRVSTNDRSHTTFPLHNLKCSVRADDAPKTSKGVHWQDDCTHATNNGGQVSSIGRIIEGTPIRELLSDGTSIPEECLEGTQDGYFRTKNTQKNKGNWARNPDALWNRKAGYAKKQIVNQYDGNFHMPISDVTLDTNSLINKHGWADCKDETERERWKEERMNLIDDTVNFTYMTGKEWIGSIVAEEPKWEDCTDTIPDKPWSYNAAMSSGFDGGFLIRFNEKAANTKLLLTEEEKCEVRSLFSQGDWKGFDLDKESVRLEEFDKEDRESLGRTTAMEHHAAHNPFVRVSDKTVRSLGGKKKVQPTYKSRGGYSFFEHDGERLTQESTFRKELPALSRYLHLDNLPNSVSEQTRRDFEKQSTRFMDSNIKVLAENDRSKRRWNHRLSKAHQSRDYDVSDRIETETRESTTRQEKESSGYSWYKERKDRYNKRGNRAKEKWSVDTNRQQWADVGGFDVYPDSEELHGMEMEQRRQAELRSIQATERDKEKRSSSEYERDNSDSDEQEDGEGDYVVVDWEDGDSEDSEGDFVVVNREDGDSEDSEEEDDEE